MDEHPNRKTQADSTVGFFPVFIASFPFLSSLSDHIGSAVTSLKGFTITTAQQIFLLTTVDTSY